MYVLLSLNYELIPRILLLSVFWMIIWQPSSWKSRNNIIYHNTLPRCEPPSNVVLLLCCGCAPRVWAIITQSGETNLDKLLLFTWFWQWSSRTWLKSCTFAHGSISTLHLGYYYYCIMCCFVCVCFCVKLDFCQRVAGCVRVSDKNISSTLRNECADLWNSIRIELCLWNQNELVHVWKKTTTIKLIGHKSINIKIYICCVITYWIINMVFFCS